MFKYLPTFACLILITISCSTKQIPSYYYQKSIDSTNIAASVQSIDYPWNSEGHLVDLMRQKYDDPPFISPIYILLSFENIRPDTFSIYICLYRDGDCLKIAEQYFEGGLYSIGFQKLEIETGGYGIKIVSKDEEYYEQCFLERLPDD
jgi:hypothetical protein